jgi:hypothetical protein
LSAIYLALAVKTPLTRIDIAQYLPGEPLPHDLFNGHGALVLKRGSRIDDPVRVAQLAEMRLYRVERDPVHTARAPGEAFCALARRYGDITDAARILQPGELLLLADDLQILVAEHSDVCVGMVRHLPMLTQSRCQALFVAILGSLVASAMGLEKHAQRTVICAALSMNLSSFDLQDDLNREARPPNQSEYEQLRMHPELSATLLSQAGVNNADWLNAVRQHHENLNHTGYPNGIGAETMAIEARILRVVDVFSALVGGRPTRTGYDPYQAMRVALERERGQLDDFVMLTLRRLIGKYPPGTLVRLANRETAVVTHWFRNMDLTAFVVSLLRPSGDPLPWPQPRDTGIRAYSIRGYTSLPSAKPLLDWPSIWGQFVPNI